jgi:hypothetical protein
VQSLLPYVVALLALTLGAGLVLVLKRARLAPGQLPS